MKNWLWKIFGNNDDWPPPDWYRPGQPLWWRKLCWLVRNPLHNFTFYTIGLKGEHFLRYNWQRGNLTNGWMLTQNTDQYAERGFKFYLLFCSAKFFAVRPFMSYQRLWKKYETKFYIGWRPYEGALGAKLWPFKKRK